MLHRLKKICVTRKILWYHTIIKVGVNECYQFLPERHAITLGTLHTTFDFEFESIDAFRFFFFLVEFK